MPAFDALPTAAAWRHVDAREGFEVVLLDAAGDRVVARGRTAAVQDGRAWAARWTVELDGSWRTRTARVEVEDVDGVRSVMLAVDGGRWTVDGRPEPALDGCVDVDLEVSVFTNALPLHRLALEVGAAADVPAAFVPATAGVHRLEQHYRRLPDHDGQTRVDYAAPAFDFRAVLGYDRAGLIVDYPGLAVRCAVPG